MKKVYLTIFIIALNLGNSDAIINESFIGNGNQKLVNIKTYYSVLSSFDSLKINQFIEILDAKPTTSDIQAYKATLIMKKASFLPKPIQKIEMFNEGKDILEAEIISNPNNVEYRFLRLIIQEHAPKILKYNGNIEEDVLLIVENFPVLNEVLKVIIMDYSITSLSLEFKD